MKNLLCFLISGLLLFSCKKDNNVSNRNNTIPVLTTTPVTLTTTGTATGGGNISDDGGSAVTMRGVCWGTTINPTTGGSHSTDGSGAGTFSSTLTGLAPASTYYVRAYATNSEGTAYGNELTFETGSPTVYVVGVEFITIDSTVAKIWRNGVPKILNNPGEKTGAQAVFVTDTDEYVLGHGYDGVNHKVKLWKNGVVSTISSAPNNYEYSLFVSGSDVYIGGTIVPSGFSNYAATIWKNGVPIYLTDGARAAIVRGVFVSGADVYAAGHESNGTFNVAKVWKNGVPISLTDGTHDGYAGSVYVSGTDVYVAGFERSGVFDNGVMKIWKNGTLLSTLSDGINNTTSESIVVSGSDVYATGIEYIAGIGTGKYWKNGVANILTDGTQNADAAGLAVVGSDVYVAGSEKPNSGNNIAKLWKNGVATNLSDGTRGVAAIGVFCK